LTRDYLVEGQLRPQGPDYVDEFVPALLRLLQANNHLYVSNYTVFDGHMRPASNLAAPPQAFARWTLLLGWDLLALVPQDAASQAALRDAYSHYQFPFPATVYFGSYRARGNLLLDGSDGFADLSTYMPMADVTIDCLLPGGQLTNLQAPWLLLNGVAVQGDVREA
jgi:hypothetical protein